MVLPDAGPPPDPGEVAASLRAVLGAVDAGEVSADDVQRAYLAGAADVLESIARPLADPALDLIYGKRWTNLSASNQPMNSSPTSPYTAWVYGKYAVPAGHNGHVPTC